MVTAGLPLKTWSTALMLVALCVNRNTRGLTEHLQYSPTLLERSQSAALVWKEAQNSAVGFTSPSPIPGAGCAEDLADP